MTRSCGGNRRYVDHDPSNGNSTLYFYPNGTTPLPPSVVVPVMETVIAVQGSGPEHPAVNITISGITIAHSASTFLEAYEVPSGGDWCVLQGHCCCCCCCCH